MNEPPLPSRDRLGALADALPRARVALVGDLAADCYIVGETSRISREAPVLIIRQFEEFLVPGQAGNTAANVAAHGATVHLVGFLGHDAVGEELRATLDAGGIDTSGIVVADNLHTLTKTRILAGSHHTRRQQVVRVDREDMAPASLEARRHLVESLHEAIAEADCCIVSDYGYQVVTAEEWGEVRRLCSARGIPLLLDSRHRLATFRGADLVTPNEEEALALGGWRTTQEAPPAASVGHTVLERSGAGAVVLTRGNEGMLVAAHPGAPMPFETGLRGKTGHDAHVAFGVHGTTEAVDVSGAGDTVVATLAMALAVGATLVEAAHLANVAAGIVVGKMGAASASPQELAAALMEWPAALQPAPPDHVRD